MASQVCSGSFLYRFGKNFSASGNMVSKDTDFCLLGLSVLGE
jgi:hypothetical protein